MPDLDGRYDWAVVWERERACEWAAGREVVMVYWTERSVPRDSKGRHGRRREEGGAEGPR